LSSPLPRFASCLILAACALGAFAQSGRTLVVAPEKAMPGEARHALVIGNGAYANGPLRNPVNDARAMAKALGAAGFEVLLVENGTQGAMQRAIRTFGDKIAQGGVGLFYYAGHGIQARGRNYMIPVNADIAREYEIEFGSIDVNLVLAMMDAAKNPLNIVILDACRNNPFARNFRSLQTGLAQMDAPTGTFIAFATAPGSIAADGAGEHGVYTKHLLAEMHRPGVPIELMFKQVRNGVMADTNGQQIPWESSSLRGEFVFTPGGAPSVQEAVAAALKHEREMQRQEMEKVLAAALDRQRKELESVGLQAARPPGDPAAVEIAFWESVKGSSNPGEYRAYLEQFPQGRFVALAKSRIAALEKAAAATASIAPPAAAQPPSGGRLPQAGDTWSYLLTEPKRVDGPKQRAYSVKVAAASPTAILEQYAVADGPSGEWAHVPGSYILSQGAALFSPYLGAFAELTPHSHLGRIEINDRNCAGNYACRVEGRVVGRESVKTAAGSFDAVKVVIEQSWSAVAGAFSQMAPQFNGGRTLTVWYSPQAKRAVKYSSRTTFGSVPPIEPDFDLELMSYKVQ
jgi:hypothetical protein